MKKIEKINYGVRKLTNPENRAVLQDSFKKIKDGNANELDFEIVQRMIDRLDTEADLIESAVCFAEFNYNRWVTFKMQNRI